MQQLRRRLKNCYHKRRDVLFHGTGHGSAIIESNLMLSARSGWHLISFTRDSDVAVHFATLNPSPTILVFDRTRLSAQFEIVRFRDRGHDESEEALWGQDIERVCDYIVDIVTNDRAEEDRLKMIAGQKRERPRRGRPRKLPDTCSLRRPHTLRDCDPLWEQKRMIRLSKLPPDVLEMFGLLVD